MKKIFNLLTIVAITLTVSACGGKINEQEQTYSQEIYENTETGQTLKIVKSDAQDISVNPKQARVGLLLPLSGTNSHLGKNLLDSTQMAVYDLNATNIHLVPIDTNMPEKAVASKIATEKLDVLVGPLFAEDTKKIYPIAKQNNLCMISFSNDNALAGQDCLFLIGVMPDESVKRVINYSTSQGIENIYAVLPKSKYGTVIEKDLANLNPQDNAKVQIIARYTNSSNVAEVSQAASNIENFAKGNAAVFIPESGSILKAIDQKLVAKQNSLSKYRLLGTGLWDNEKVGDSNIVEGAIFASPPKKLREAFEKRFATHYGYKPTKLATLSYDAVALITALKSNGRAIDKTNLLNPYGFKGLTGLFRFTESGLNERSLSIYTIKKGNIVELESAPISFKS